MAKNSHECCFTGYRRRRSDCQCADHRQHTSIRFVPFRPNVALEKQYFLECNQSEALQEPMTAIERSFIGCIHSLAVYCSKAMMLTFRN